MSGAQARLARLERGAPPPATGHKRLHVPNIIEFVTSADYLDRPMLYPRQATVLKVLMLELELLTEFDLKVIAQWEAGFTLVDRDEHQFFEGACGLAPGTVERMLACRAEGRIWFREVVLVLGRRAGKGYLSSLMTAYLLWRLLALGNPQQALGIAKGKQLVVMTMAADLLQAVGNLHRDVVELLLDAPCFAPYLGAHTTTSLRLRTPSEVSADPLAEGSVLIQARPATGTAGRGPTAVAFLFDEMAHAPASGLQRGADEIYRGATPALAQFPTTSLILLASSPASQTGEFYAAHRRALDTTGGQPRDPTMITLQLPSWGLYEDWELTHQNLAMYPGGPPFAPLARAIVDEDSPHVQRLAVSNRDTYRVEHLAQWRSSLAAYLDPDLVTAIFGPHNGAVPIRQSSGDPQHRYVMHCDPSVSGANFGIAIGHLQGGPAPAGHVVFDYLHAYQPTDFPDGRISYPFVEEQLRELIVRFRPSVVTFDAYNSEQLVQGLRAWARDEMRMSGLDIGVRVPTATRNWTDAERFKTLVGEGRIHAHQHGLAANELRFLEVTGTTVDHPRTGPVTTSDISDAMFNVVAHLMSGNVDVIDRLSATGLGASQAGGFITSGGSRNPFSRTPGAQRGQGPRSPARGRGR